MRIVYLGILIAAVVGVVYTLITSYNEFQPSYVVSVDKPNFHHFDTANWRVKGLPANADYKTILGWGDDSVLLPGGTANAKGEAAGSFLIGDNIPPGAFTLRIELASNPSRFGEVSMNVSS